MKIADLVFDIAPVSDPVAPSPAELDGATETILSRFAAVAGAHGQRPAVVDETGSDSFAELDAWSNRIAWRLHDWGLGPETRVAVMMSRHRGFIAAALGILKAGCVYVPLDPTQPLPRRRLLVDGAGARAMLADAAAAADMRRLQWMCPELEFGCVLDAAGTATLIEAPGALMSAELWDRLAAEGADDVDAGGWKSAFTGQPIAPEAMDAFGANARAKAAPLLSPTARVLEIGCASGFTMRHLAPLCGSYVASDLSRLNVERVETIARGLGLAHVTGRQLAAHDIDILPPGSFDVVVLNSVVESFPGYAYLDDVLDKAATLLAPGGGLFIGSVWDLDRRDAYQNDIAEFARRHAGEGFSPRLDVIDSFYLPQGYFRDWAARRRDRPSLAFSPIVAPGFDPAPYGFDLTVRFDGRGEGACATRISVGTDALTGPSTRPPPVEVTPGQAAYVIFTSGTTGRPKGVLVEHAPVINLTDTIDRSLYQPLAQGGQQIAISCCFSFAFDGSIHQIFTTLLSGHTLHLPGDETRRDPARLHAFIEAHRLDVCDATPSLFAMLVDHWRDTGTATSVRCFILGGEPVKTEMMRRLYAIPAHRDLKVVNQYGPTETCVCATQFIMTAAGWQEHLPPPIGTPLDGVQVRLCDSAGREVPDGVPGEIRIGGHGVARGYLNDPQQTGQRFVHDAAGRRWYCTGDMARRIGGGLLQFIGREDRQVKIRGYRIELAEVEARLARHPLIRQAVVVAADPRGDGDRVLVAYVVPHDGFDVNQCRTELDATMAAWMVPSWLVTIDALPLTANGKIDERRLPPPSDLAARERAAGRPLENDDERRLAALWAGILDVPVESADDDFFMLGGHSVLAVRLQSAVDRAFGVRLPLAEMFTSPTIATMAALIHTRGQSSDWHPVVALNAAGSRVPLICFHPVGGNVLCYRDLAEALGADQPVYMVQSYGLEDGQPLYPSVEEMVDAYLAAIRETVPAGPVALAGWSFGGLLAWQAACRLQRVGVQVAAVVVLDGVAVPEVVRDFLRQDEADFLAALFDEMGLFDAATLRALPPEQRLDLILDRGKGGHFLPDDMDRAGMRRLMALFQNNALAAVRYRPGRLDGRLLLVRPREASRQAPGVPGDDLNGWGPLPTGGVELRWMDGTHGQILYQPWLSQLAGHLRGWLDAVNR